MRARTVSSVIQSPVLSSMRARLPWTVAMTTYRSLTRVRPSASTDTLIGPVSAARVSTGSGLGRIEWTTPATIAATIAIKMILPIHFFMVQSLVLSTPTRSR
jgi:hypothetical protein